MVNMEIINDAELLANLAIRYKKHFIYTYVGPTLLTVNPFMFLPGYSEPEVKKQYIDTILSSSNYKD
jgi:myosin heavy subunit